MITSADLVATSTTTFADLLTQLYTQRFTGTLILHCAEGTPRKVEFPLQVIPGRQVTLTPSGGGR